MPQWPHTAWASSTDLDHQAAMAAFPLFVALGPIVPIDEGCLAARVQAGLITLDGQQIVPALGHDLPGNGLLAPHGIDAHQEALEVEDLRSLGMAMISLLFCATFSWPRARPRSVAKALNRWMGDSSQSP